MRCGVERGGEGTFVFATVVRMSSSVHKQVRQTITTATATSHCTFVAGGGEGGLICLQQQSFWENL